MQASGRAFTSDTDTEVVAHLIELAVASGKTLLDAVQHVLPQLEGAYALAIVDREAPNRIVVARQGSPLVLGIGIGENFAGSDTLSLRSVTDTFIYLEDGDLAELSADGYRILDATGQIAERAPTRLAFQTEDEGLGGHEHFMLKEIFEQPARLRGAEVRDDAALRAGVIRNGCPTVSGGGCGLRRRSVLAPCCSQGSCRRWTECWSPWR